MILYNLCDVAGAEKMAGEVDLCANDLLKKQT